MYLYVALAFMLCLGLADSLGAPWTQFATVPPLDLLQRVPLGREASWLIILLALYGLVWMMVSLGLQAFAGLAPADSAQGQSAVPLAAAGYSRAGLEPYLWATLAGVPIAVGLLLDTEGFTPHGAEALVVGGAIAMAAAQALRPFNMREDVMPALRQMSNRLSISVPAEAAVPQGNEAASSIPEVRQPVRALGDWGEGWRELRWPGDIEPGRYRDPGPDELNEELAAYALRYGEAFPMTPDQQQAILTDLHSLLSTAYAEAVAWGYTSTQPLSNEDSRHLLLSLSVYAVSAQLPTEENPEPVALAPYWAEGSAEFHVWYRPSPAFLKLTAAEQARWIATCRCMVHTPVTGRFAMARPLVTIRAWYKRADRYLVKESYDVNAD